MYSNRVLPDFTLQQYKARLAKVEEELVESGIPQDYLDEVAATWLYDIAPVKAEEYGIHAWLLLGARGLFAEINGCYWRWRRLTDLGETYDFSPAMQNAIVDFFGYAVMMNVFVELVRRPRDLHTAWQSLLSDDATIRVDMNAMFEGVWETGYIEGDEGIRAMRAAYFAWRGSNRVPPVGSTIRETNGRDE